MPRVWFPLALLVALAPFSLAHFPPGPNPNCENVFSALYHDYVGFSDAGGPSARAPAQDGNLAACPGPSSAPLDYDGHHEFGFGVARLAVETGDFATSGSWICISELGHHAPAVYALDSLGFGPSFAVLADHSLDPPASGPDCGDGQIMPCTQVPPSEDPFPVNVVDDTANALLEGAFEGVCNPRDVEFVVEGHPGGVSGGPISFGPGADGTYHVIIHADHNTPLYPAGGHVWTN